MSGLTQSRTRVQRVLAGLCAAALAAVVLTIFGLPTPAEARPDCPQGSACFYTRPNFQGEQIVTNPTTGCNTLPREFFSVQNRTNFPLVMAEDPDCFGDNEAVLPGEDRPFLDPPAHSFLAFV